MVGRFWIFSMLRAKKALSDSDIRDILECEQNELAEGIIEYLIFAQRKREPEIISFFDIPNSLKKTNQLQNQNAKEKNSGEKGGCEI